MLGGGVSALRRMGTAQWGGSKAGGKGLLLRKEVGVIHPRSSPSQPSPQLDSRSSPLAHGVCRAHCHLLLSSLTALYAPTDPSGLKDVGRLVALNYC